MPKTALERSPVPPSLKDATWLKRPETARVFAALAGPGIETRAVGGAVRNSLLGLPVTEVDLATTAPPEQVMALARKAGLKAVPTGIEHGTVTVIADGVPFEVTTLRRDVETFGRHATVAFTENWEEDARRRDFTLNALYAASDGTVLDPLAGYDDIVTGRVRFIDRFVTDPEIPVLSVVDMGIIAGVQETDAGVIVDITPTFAACPATALIREQIRDAVAAATGARVTVNIVFDPPWTSERMSPEGREKLTAFGVAPPGSGAMPTTQTPELRHVACPFCGSAKSTSAIWYGSIAKMSGIGSSSIHSPARTPPSRPRSGSTSRPAPRCARSRARAGSSPRTGRST